MAKPSYLREQAAKFREVAAADTTGILRDKLVALAEQCEMLAQSIERQDAAGGEEKAAPGDA
jgi:hypothetical protein